MKINIFDGGKSVRTDPSLLPSNEAVKYVNIDNTELTLKSCTIPVRVPNVIIGGYFYNFKNSWISSTVERTYQEYKEVLYYTEDGTFPKKNNGSGELRLGIDNPKVKLNTIQLDPVDANVISTDSEVIQYLYTYYNSTYDIESAPSPISDELTLAANKIAYLSGFIASTDPQVDKLRVYRLGANATIPTLVVELDNSALFYTDKLKTVDLIGTLLNTYDHQIPEVGLKYLTEVFGTFFAVLDDRLYFNKVGYPDAWPAENFLDFGFTLTGLLLVPDGLLVFSRTKTWLLLGDDPSNFRVIPISDEQGCISHSSAKKVKGKPVWCSANGICTYAGGIVDVISLDKLDQKEFKIVNTAVQNQQYYICQTNGTLTCMDLRFNQSYKDYKFDEAVDNIVVHNNILYGRQQDKLVELFPKSCVCERFHYRSPVFTEGEHSNIKLYNNIYIRANGNFEVKVIIDGLNVVEKVISGNDIHEILPEAVNQRGSSIQFDITGRGTVYEIEYKVAGRENGR